jgi:hypothetical protein
MWILNNNELESTTYERKYSLGLFTLDSYKFPLVNISKSLTTNPIESPILYNPNDVVSVDTTPLVPSNIGYFYLIRNLVVDLDYLGLTSVTEPDLIINRNTYYVNQGNLEPYALVHTDNPNLLDSGFKYQFNFVVPQRNDLYEYEIGLSNFPYVPESLDKIEASGINFYDMAASTGCPNYFTFVDNKIILKGCETCRPITGDTGTIYGTRDIGSYTRYTAYKFDFDTSISIVTSLTYKGDIYDLSNRIESLTLLFSSELSSALALKS